MPDDEIDTDDIPEVDLERRLFASRPNQGEPRLWPVGVEADLVTWFLNQSDASTYQHEINKALRAHIVVTDAKTRKRRA
jgi:uncharacterized protein (DUF4415 family)